MLKKYKAYLNIILKRLFRGFTAVVAVGMAIAMIVTGALSVQRENYKDMSDTSEEGNLLDEFFMGDEKIFAGRNLLEERSNIVFADSSDFQTDDDSIMLFSLSDSDAMFYSSGVEPDDYAVSAENLEYYETVQKTYRQLDEEGWQDEDMYQNAAAELENGLAVSAKAEKVESAVEAGTKINVIEEKRLEKEKLAEEQRLMEEAVLKGQAEAAERKAEKERREAEEAARAAEEAARAAEEAAKAEEEKKNSSKKKTTGLTRMEEDPDAEYDHSEDLVYKYNRKMDIEVTDEEYEVLCRIVEAEAGDQDVYGRILVANVILNRVRYKKEFANNIIDVVFAPNQFAPTRDGSYYRVKVDNLTKEAVNRATSGEDYSQGALYFFMRSGTTASKASWFDTLHFLFKYGCHEFFK